MFYDNTGTGIASLAEVPFGDNQQTFTTLAIRGNSMQILTQALGGAMVDDAVIRSRAAFAAPH